MERIMKSIDDIRASELLTLVYEDVDITDILDETTVTNIGSIRTEKIMKSSHDGIRGDRHTNTRTFTKRDDSSYSREKSSIQKPVLKKKATSFDEAMKQKITTELNKISPTNYQAILNSIDAIYGRLSDDEHEWALRLIMENASHQHIFAEQYVNLYKDLIIKNNKDMKLANTLLVSFMNEHKNIILTNIDNGDNYDEFCKANKQKVSSIGMSVLLGEVVNKNMIPVEDVAKHAIAMIETLKDIRSKATDVPKETTENSINCVLQFFTVVSKTKLTKPGFKDCVSRIHEFMDEEIKDRKMSPKARFSVMNFVEDIEKLIKEKDVPATLYRPSHLSQE